MSNAPYFNCNTQLFFLGWDRWLCSPSCLGLLFFIDCWLIFHLVRLLSPFLDFDLADLSPQLMFHLAASASQRCSTSFPPPLLLCYTQPLVSMTTRAEQEKNWWGGGDGGGRWNDNDGETGICHLVSYHITLSIQMKLKCVLSKCPLRPSAALCGPL